MYVLGFNSTHDASVALLRDGRILWALEEERLSRRKHHHGFPELALRFVLRAEGIRFSDVEHVAFYWNPWKGLFRFGGHFLAHLPRSLAYARVQPAIWREFATLPRRLRRDLGFQGRFHFVDHHLAHAYSAFAPSPFEEASILSVDGTGEWTTTLLARGDARGVRSVRRIGYPHSIGKVYEAVTQYLGFRPLCDEGKVMGLAAYGGDRFVEDFREILAVNGSGSLRVDRSFFRYHLGAPEKFSPRLEERFGARRAMDADAPIEAHHRDVAFALQARTEEALLALAEHLHRTEGGDALCLAGGVALNCVANGRLLRESPFREIFIQPAAGDSGAALGAAMRTHHRVTGEMPRTPLRHVYLGPEYDESDFRHALREAGLSWERPPDIAAACAAELDEGRIVGWFQGRMEYGPRALGNRSILADPRPSGMRDRLNARVKQREAFRPFAPAVLAERASEYFEDARSSPFMLLSFRARPDRREQIPAVVHVDGTARVQTVAPETNPLLHRLIGEFAARTGVPMILNTSFNLRGEPIVCTPADAVRSFVASEMDRLVLGPYLARKGGGA
jgi:carbamoyltransferase